jgi:16S rRNA (cytosine967-C5)-methyltransferase
MSDTKPPSPPSNPWGKKSAAASAPATPASSSAKARVEAARVIAHVMAGTNLDNALTRVDVEAITPQQMPMLRALCNGVLRDWSLLNALLSKMMEKPLNKEPELQALILGGLFQLRSMRVAQHAAVNETVEGVTLLGKDKLRGLVNAILRRYQREREALEAQLPTHPAKQYSYPSWLADQIQGDWPNWPTILAAGNEQGPLTLRVNRRRMTRDAYLKELEAAGIAATAVPFADDAVTLAEAIPVEKIPLFSNGTVSVQDAAAQLAAELLQVEPGMRVLDACAAPGGKTAHLLEHYDHLDLLAMDHDPMRLKRVYDNLRRLDLDAPLVRGDATDTRDWWDHNKFDRILLDAPCSGSGVIRRHPDIKWLRRHTDIPQLAEMQLLMLNSLWPLLAPGGVLLYATCSILRMEGESVIKNFLKNQPAAKHSPIEAEWGEGRSVGRRIAPGGAFDGFYYARLSKPR